MTYFAQKLQEAGILASVDSLNHSLYGCKEKQVPREDTYYQQIFDVKLIKENN